MNFPTTQFHPLFGRGTGRMPRKEGADLAVMLPRVPPRRHLVYLGRDLVLLTTMVGVRLCLLIHDQDGNDQDRHDQDDYE